MRTLSTHIRRADTLCGKAKPTTRSNTMAKRDSFPGYPNVKAGWVHTDRYGDVKLVEVNTTSDGFLIGTGKTRSGELVSSLFLGKA